MCGRYVTGTDEHDWRSWATLLGLTTDVAAPPDGANSAKPFVPTASVPILRHAPDLDAGVELVWARWGLVPSWMDRPLQRPPQYNVRIETAPSKFKKYLATRRCVLPASGFWLARERGSEPLFVRVPDQPVFGIAGLWTERELDGEQLRSCTILTTESDAELGRFHERMPIVLSPTHARRWLAPDCEGPEIDSICASPPVLAVA